MRSKRETENMFVCKNRGAILSANLSAQLLYAYAHSVAACLCEFKSHCSCITPHAFPPYIQHLYFWYYLRLYHFCFDQPRYDFNTIICHWCVTMYQWGGSIVYTIHLFFIHAMYLLYAALTLRLLEKHKQDRANMSSN